MNAATTHLLVIVISQQGYWLSGQQQTIDLHWAVKKPPTSVEELQVRWQLSLDDVLLASGIMPLAKANPASSITLQAPAIRTPVQLTWRYQLLNGQKQLDSDQVGVFVFPDYLLKGLKSRLAGESLLLVGDAADLSKLLEDAQIPHRPIADAQELAFSDGRLVVVTKKRIDGQAQTVLGNVARAGASVLVLDQPSGESLWTWPVVARQPPPVLTWRSWHSVFSQIDARMLRALLGHSDELRPIQIPTEAGALSLLHWPRPDQRQPSPRSSLLALYPVGMGQLIFCQLPLDQWQRDPRSQILFRNILDTMLTRQGRTSSSQEVDISDDLQDKRKPSLIENQTTILQLSH